MPLDPAVTRDGDRILIDGEEVDRSTGPIHGIAMDLGTTTIVLRLFDLETGELVADASFENPQRFGGSDVMARIHYDTQHPRQAADAHARRLSDRTPSRSFRSIRKTIYEMVVVGNSTMRDLFFRQNVYSIGQSPYRSITEIEMAEGKRTTTSLTQTGRRCLLPIHPKARVYGAPIISGHVGADAAACMLAVDLAHEDRLVAIMDIGTNTELIVGNRHRILAASCPAGPAFEGGAIACGMPGLDGAIEDVAHRRRRRISSRRHRRRAARRHLRLGPGRSDERAAPHRADERAWAASTMASPRSRSTTSTTSTFSESDVNELAQAKGANVAGLQTVFSNYGIAVRRHRRVLPGRRLRPAPERRRRQAHRADSRICRTRRSCKSATRRSKARASPCSRSPSGRNSKQLVQASRALPAGNASALLRFLRRRLPVQARRIDCTR